MKAAFLFPGQGAQKVGMAQDFYENYSESKEVFELADSVMDEDLIKLIFEGPEEELLKTEFTQPAIVTASYATYVAFRKHCDLEPAFLAGHSLGEFSALVVSGALEINDAVRLVNRRGKFVQESIPLGLGGMAALLGGDLMQITRMIKELENDGCLEIANFNSPGQIVISGDINLINKAIKAATDYGIKRAIPLKVSAPFHSGLMEPAKQKLKEELAVTNFHEMKYPVVTNVGAVPNQDFKRLPEILADQIASAVLWEQSVGLMISEGTNLFLEFGASVLTQMLNRGFKDFGEFTAISIGNLDQLASALSSLKDMGIEVRES